MTSKADALLDAHVAFVCEQLQGDALRPLIADALDAALADTSKIKLKALVSSDAVKQTALHYAAEFEPGPGIPELVGKVWRSIYRHKIHDRTTLAELLPDQMFEEFLDKVLELDDMVELAVHESVSNPIYASLITELTYTGVRDYLKDSQVTKRIPGARSALKIGKALVDRARPDLGDAMEDSIKTYVSRNAKASLKLSERFLIDTIRSDRFRETLLEMWADNSHRTVASLRSYADSVDGEEFFVIAYEYWKHLRTTDWYQQMICAGIDAVFAAYGNRGLGQLIKDLGLNGDGMLEDAMRFAPRLISGLQQAGVLEPMVRRNLAPFYGSKAAAAILG